MNDDTVEEYAVDMQQGAVFPPVVAFYDGQFYWLADGFHRVGATESLGRTAIAESAPPATAAEVKQGSRRDAVLYSCSVNAKHGLRRTNADKQRAVMQLLNDEEWSKWSNREISRRCGVSLDLVNRLRSSLNDSFSDKSRTYKTKHGTVAKMKTANIGKARQSKENSAEPPSQPTTVEQELKQKEKNLGLSYNKRTDQVLPDVERNHASPSDVDDRPGADVAIMKMDDRTKQALAESAPPATATVQANLETMTDTQLKVMGGILARRCPGKAEVLASAIAGSGEELAVAAVKSAVLVFPEAVKSLLLQL